MRDVDDAVFALVVVDADEDSAGALRGVVGVMAVLEQFDDGAVS